MTSFHLATGHPVPPQPAVEPRPAFHLALGYAETDKS